MYNVISYFPLNVVAELVNNKEIGKHYPTSPTCKLFWLNCMLVKSSSPTVFLPLDYQVFMFWMCKNNRKHHGFFQLGNLPGIVEIPETPIYVSIIELCITTIKWYSKIDFNVGQLFVSFMHNENKTLKISFE